MHYAQITTSSQFSALDYEQLKQIPSYPQQNSSENLNLKLHGSLTPPMANLENIRTPVAMIVAESDVLGTVLDS